MGSHAYGAGQSQHQGAADTAATAADIETGSTCGKSTGDLGCDFDILLHFRHFICVP